MRLIATIALLALGLGAALPALAETNVGVTAAVNQDAKGVIGSNIKTISLGDSVVFNQRIETGAGGLVQLLLADGTTFMVGPNSDLVIDSFVYDPNAGTAQVAATFTKGVLRFIGGQTSKTDGGVTINTPVGTMGIRGAMVDVVLDPPAGTPPHVDMLFGNEVTLEQGQQLLGRLYAAGYSLALGPDGKFQVLKTPPGWGSQIQAALAGRTGTKGGAPKGPSDGDVQNSDVADNNSGNGVNKNTGQPPLTQDEIDALLYAAAHYDEIKQEIGEGAVVSVKAAYAGGIIDLDWSGESGEAIPMFLRSDEETGAPILAEVGYDSQGRPRGLDFEFGEAGSSGTLFDMHLEKGEATLEADYLPSNVSVTGTGSIALSDLDPEDLPDCQCFFIDWGFWSLSADATDGSQTAHVGDVTDGTWVAGDLTSLGNLEGLAASETAVATYNGIAAGTVTNAAGTDIHGAIGDLYMLWSFASRDGVIEISDFDGKSMSGSLSGSEGLNGFGGWLNGQDGQGRGAAVGSFVDDSSGNGAAGVMGSFAFRDQDADWYASGIFLGGLGEDVAGLPGAFFGGVYTGPMECEYEDCIQPSAPGVNGFDYEYGEPEYSYLPDLLTYTPTLAKLTFDEDDKPISIDASFMATIHCDECGFDGDEVSVVYNGDGTNGKLTMKLPDDEGPTQIDTTLNHLFAYSDSSEANPLNGVPNEYYPNDTYADQLDCDSCNDFIKWGFWGFSAENLQVGDVTGNVDYQGAWIHGDLTTRAQMANLAALEEGDYEATYTGDAVGVVYNSEVGEGGSTYLATGNLAMTYNFGAREGTVDIIAFDAEHRANIDPGIDIHYGIDGPTSGSDGFIGFMSGEGYGGAVQGAFVNDGGNAAAGVIGNWNYSEGFDSSPSYTASGVFMGERPTY